MRTEEGCGEIGDVWEEVLLYCGSLSNKCLRTKWGFCVICGSSLGVVLVRGNSACLRECSIVEESLEVGVW